MSDYPEVIGVDPGFANFGVAVIRLLPKEEEILFVDSLRTKPSLKRRNILAVDDDSRRLSWLAEKFDALCMDHGARAIIAEEKRRLPHSGSATKLAMGWAVALLVATLRGIPFCQVTPGEIKLVTAGSERANKTQVEESIRERYHGSPAISAFDRRMWDKTRQQLMKRREHGYDAIGAVVAALNSNIIRAIRPR